MSQPGLGFLLTAWLWLSLSGLALVIGLVWVGLGAVWLALITGGSGVDRRRSSSRTPMRIPVCA